MVSKKVQDLSFVLPDSPHRKRVPGMFSCFKPYPNIILMHTKVVDSTSEDKLQTPNFDELNAKGETNREHLNTACSISA
jgi:hypothetical protein